MELSTTEITAELWSVLYRIAATFDESADKWTADRQLCLEDVEARLSALIDRLEGAGVMTWWEWVRFAVWWIMVGSFTMVVLAQVVPL